MFYSPWCFCFSIVVLGRRLLLNLYDCLSYTSRPTRIEHRDQQLPRSVAANPSVTAPNKFWVRRYSGQGSQEAGWARPILWPASSSNRPCCSSALLHRMATVVGAKKPLTAYAQNSHSILWLPQGMWLEGLSPRLDTLHCYCMHIYIRPFPFGLHLNAKHCISPVQPKTAVCCAAILPENKIF